MLVVVLAITTILSLGCPPTPVTPPPFTQFPGVKVVDMIPAALSGETNQDSEPFLAIHPTNPLAMAASAFTLNPGGPSSTTAPIFISQDGGQTWTLNNIVPSPVQTIDITHAFDAGAGNLFGGILRSTDGNLLELITTTFSAPTVMTTQASRPDDDQPFVRATTVGPNNRIYIGSNDFSQFATTGHTATVDVSGNNGVSYSQVRVESRNSANMTACGNPGSQDGPSIRPSIAKDNTIYAAFFGWRAFDCNTGMVNSDVVVVRDDSGGVGASPFTDLKDPNDTKVGVRAVPGVTIPWSNAQTLAQERIGSTLSLAVDPNNSSTVYVAWADRVGNGDIYTIHVRRSTDRGVHWSSDLFTQKNATNSALAVADNGTVGLLYQAHVGTGIAGTWETHLIQTKDAFTTKQDGVLAATPSDQPPAQYLPYLGDYVGLMAVGSSEFRGVFSANNTPDNSHFPQGVTYQRVADFNSHTLGDGQGGTVDVSIDVFYFSFPVLP